MITLETTDPTMNILGISCYYHDAAACLVQDGRIVAAVEEERYTRRKHDSAFPVNAAKDCLRMGGIEGANIDRIAFYESPRLKIERMLAFGITQDDLDGSFDVHFDRTVSNQVELDRRVREDLGYDGPIECCEHHMSHMASAYYISGFDEAAILTIDGVGEWSTTSIGEGRGESISMIEELNYPHSLGLFYSAFTAYLGFKVNNDEYKVMGLAAYGKPTYVDQLSEILRLEDNGHYSLNVDAFDYYRCRNRMFSDLIVDMFGEPRAIESELTEVHRNLAASVQEICTQAMMGLAKRARDLTNSDRLCMAGGVALNCLANQRIVEQGPFKDIVIQPAAGDSGGAIGAALWCASQQGDRLQVDPVPDYSSYLGPGFDDDEIESVLKQAGASYRRYSPEELCRVTASLLNRDKIVSWFQGRMEFGPRALGCRSIIASPLNPDIKEIINRRIKFREPFRPFAPVSTIEDASTYFDVRRPYPYMLVTCGVRPEWQDKLPGITHEDGSARLQTVARSHNPMYYDLIRSFGEQTGVPVLINTSFNVRGEPIVCTPMDAYRCFTLTDVDVLAIGNFLVERLW